MTTIKGRYTRIPFIRGGNRGRPSEQRSTSTGPEICFKHKARAEKTASGMVTKTKGITKPT